MSLDVQGHHPSRSIPHNWAARILPSYSFDWHLRLRVSVDDLHADIPPAIVVNSLMSVGSPNFHFINVEIQSKFNVPKTGSKTIIFLKS